MYSKSCDTALVSKALYDDLNSGAILEAVLAVNSSWSQHDLCPSHPLRCPHCHVSLSTGSNRNLIKTAEDKIILLDGMLWLTDNGPHRVYVTLE